MAGDERTGEGDAEGSSAEPAREPRGCRITGEGQVRTLSPGDVIRVGRAPDNDIVIDDLAVSRFHARFCWDSRLELPIVFDNGSKNGTEVNDRSVRTMATLQHGALVKIGEVTFRVELDEGHQDQPAILRDTGELVRLFTEDRVGIDGTLEGKGSLLELLKRLEVERRTGTLTLELSAGRARIVLCLGRIMVAEAREAKGREALGQVLKEPRCAYSFCTLLEPQEEAMNLWISDFLRERRMRARSTHRLSRLGSKKA